MAFSGQVLHNPVSGERFVFQTTLGLRTVAAGPGDLVVVEPGTFHRFANAGDEPAVVRVRVEPTLRMEELFETVAALAAIGERRGLGERYRLYHQITGEPATGQPGDAGRRVPPSRRLVRARPYAGRAPGTRPGPDRPGSSRPAPGRPGAARLTGRRRAAGIRGESE